MAQLLQLTALLISGRCHLKLPPQKIPPLRCGLLSEFFDHLLLSNHFSKMFEFKHLMLFKLTLLCGLHMVFIWLCLLCSSCALFLWFLWHCHPTMSSKNIRCIFGSPSIHSIICLSRQILLPRYLMNGLSGLDETYREYSLVHTDDLTRFWRSCIKGESHSWPSRWQRHPRQCWSVKVHLLISCLKSFID